MWRAAPVLTGRATFSKRHPLARLGPDPLPASSRLRSPQGRVLDCVVLAGRGSHPLGIRSPLVGQRLVTV
jgi:hypothetical protein